MSFPVTRPFNHLQLSPQMRLAQVFWSSKWLAVTFRKTGCVVRFFLLLKRFSVSPKTVDKMVNRGGGGFSSEAKPNEWKFTGKTATTALTAYRSWDFLPRLLPVLVFIVSFLFLPPDATNTSFTLSSPLHTPPYRTFPSFPALPLLAQLSY